MPEHQNDAQVAYFLAIEIYKPKKKWEKMNEMLDLAFSINPTQPLERAFSMPDGTFVQTIEEGVAVYKEELWIQAFNNGIDLADKGHLEKAVAQFNFAKNILNRIESYIASYAIYLELSNVSGANNKEYLVKAKEVLDVALKMEPNNYQVLEALGKYFYNISDHVMAKEYYSLAYDNAKEDAMKASALQNLIYINIELNNYNEAIEISNTLLNVGNNYNNTDLIYNIGVFYQNLANTDYDKANATLNQYRMDGGDDKILISIYNIFSQALSSAEQAIDNFDTVELIEIELGKDITITDEITDLNDLIEWINTQMSSIEETAIDKNIDLFE